MPRRRRGGRAAAAGPGGSRTPEVDAARGSPLAHEQRGDEEPGDDEEDVDAEEAPGQPRRVEVEDEHGGDGEGAQPVEARQPPRGRTRQGSDIGSACHGRRGRRSPHRPHVARVGGGGDAVSEARSRHVDLPSRHGGRCGGAGGSAADGLRPRACPGRGVPLVGTGTGARARPHRACAQHLRRSGRGRRRGRRGCPRPPARPARGGPVAEPPAGPRGVGVDAPVGRATRVQRLLRAVTGGRFLRRPRRTGAWTATSRAPRTFLRWRRERHPPGPRTAAVEHRQHRRRPRAPARRAVQGDPAGRSSSRRFSDCPPPTPTARSDRSPASAGWPTRRGSTRSSRRSSSPSSSPRSSGTTRRSPRPSSRRARFPDGPTSPSSHVRHRHHRPPARSRPRAGARVESGRIRPGRHPERRRELRRHRVPQDPDPAGFQVLRLGDDAAPRARDHLRRRARTAPASPTSSTPSPGSWASRARSRCAAARWRTSSSPARPAARRWAGPRSRLTIDNSDGALPIDYTEVSITRPMFRGGESEYEINGTSCRLLDVQELLSDSGIGREMHVIVGQGQLDAVLHAKPEERRGFIEEAAGVLKHRKRKEKALRKLDAMQANLNRVSTTSPPSCAASSSRWAGRPRSPAAPPASRPTCATPGCGCSPTTCPAADDAGPGGRRRGRAARPPHEVEAALDGPAQPLRAGAAHADDAPARPRRRLVPASALQSLRRCDHRSAGRRAAAPVRAGRGRAARARSRAAGRGGRARDAEEIALREAGDRQGPPQRSRLRPPAPRARTAPPSGPARRGQGHRRPARRAGQARRAGRLAAREPIDAAEGDRPVDRGVQRRRGRGPPHSRTGFAARRASPREADREKALDDALGTPRPRSTEPRRLERLVDAERAHREGRAPAARPRRGAGAGPAAQGRRRRPAGRGRAVPGRRQRRRPAARRGRARGRHRRRAGLGRPTRSRSPGSTRPPRPCGCSRYRRRPGGDAGRRAAASERPGRLAGPARRVRVWARDLVALPR